MPGSSAVSAAEQRCACLPAAFRYSLDDRRRHCRIQPGAAIVIEEEQGFCTLNHDIIDTHSDEVDAHCIVQVELDSQFQFGANTICSGHQDRLLVAPAGQLEQAAESADPTKNTIAPR